MAETKTLNLGKIINILKEHKEELKEKYGVKEIGVFGSYVREGQKKGSDLDMIIEFKNEESIRGLEFVGLIMDLEEYLHKILGIRPHLASKGHAMQSEKWKYIEKDIVCVFGEIRDEQTIMKIKEIIMETLNQMSIIVKKIILFGSRARGDFTKYSDYDFLIITERTFTIKEKMGISKRIRAQLAEMYISADIMIKSEEEIEYWKDKIGCVTRYALKGGIVI